MRAVVEWIVPKRVGIVRVGRVCYRFGSPYEYAAVFARPKYGPDKAMISALVANGGFNTAHRRAMVAKLSCFFKSAHWSRCKSWGVLKRKID